MFVLGKNGCWNILAGMCINRLRHGFLLDIAASDEQFREGWLPNFYPEARRAACPAHTLQSKEEDLQHEAAFFSPRLDGAMLCGVACHMKPC